MDNIIFLDIDGVLNCENGFRDGLCPYMTWGNTDKGEYHMKFYPQSKELINKLIEKTQSKVVASSTWRKSGLDWLKKVWELENMSGEIIGITPVMSFKSGKSVPRGCEIESYLKDKGFLHINWSDEEQLKYMKSSDIRNYIIIDDDSDMLFKQRKHFIHVEPSPRNREGFNETHYYEALDTLNKTLLTI